MSRETVIGDGAFARWVKLNKIIYMGASSEWNRIQKANWWDDQVGIYLVVYHAPSAWNEGPVTKHPTRLLHGRKSIPALFAEKT